jgi:hypothetical protein
LPPARRTLAPLRSLGATKLPSSGLTMLKLIVRHTNTREADESIRIEHVFAGIMQGFLALQDSLSMYMYHVFRLQRQVVLTLTRMSCNQCFLVPHHVSYTPDFLRRSAYRLRLSCRSYTAEAAFRDHVVIRSNVASDQNPFCSPKPKKTESCLRIAKPTSPTQNHT